MAARVPSSGPDYIADQRMDEGRHKGTSAWTGVKLIFTGGHISLTVAFEGPK